MAMTKNSNAIAYIIYMICGSYFKKAICMSKLREKQLKIAYSEQKRDNQIKLEERCDNYLNSRVLPKLPEEIFEDMVDVQFINSDNYIIVKFIGFNWTLEMWGVEENNVVNYSYNFNENN